MITIRPKKISSLDVQVSFCKCFPALHTRVAFFYVETGFFLKWLCTFQKVNNCTTDRYFSARGRSFNFYRLQKLMKCLTSKILILIKVDFSFLRLSAFLLHFCSLTLYWLFLCPSCFLLLAPTFDSPFWGPLVHSDCQHPVSLLW